MTERPTSRDADEYRLTRDQTIAAGRRVVGLLRPATLGELRAQFSSRMASAVSADALGAVAAGVGALLEPESEGAFLRSAGERTYLAEWKSERALWSVSAVFVGSRDEIAGLLVQPPTAVAETAGGGDPLLLDLPFTGEWVVAWGGARVPVNHHVVTPDQRYAYDFSVWRQGATFRASGGRNEDYWAWDRELTAPCDGVVTSVANDIPDNTPGDLGTSSGPAVAGNHVVIHAGGDAHLLLAHFRAGSIGVAVGQRVRRGQPLGRVGNSGRSSEPHVHLHAQDSPRIGSGHGRPVLFRDVVVNGTAAATGAPVQGDVLRAGASP